MNKPQPAAIDLSKYRTPELFEAVVELISIPAAVWSIMTWASCGVFVFLLVLLLPAYLSGAFSTVEGATNLATLIPAGLYAAIVGLFVGAIYGFVRLISRSIGNMLQIVEVLLQTTGTVATDYRSIQSGNAELPSPGKLIASVYEQVLLPTVERAVDSAFGIIGKPFLWFYKVSLGRMVRTAIAKTAPDSFDEIKQSVQLDALAQKQKDRIVAGMGKVAEHESGIVRTLDWMRNKIAGMGGWFKTLVLTPCYILFIVIAVIAIAVYCVVLFLLTRMIFQEAEPAAMVLHQISNWISFST